MQTVLTVDPNALPANMTGKEEEIYFSAYRAANRANTLKHAIANAHEAVGKWRASWGMEYEHKRKLEALAYVHALPLVLRWQFPLGCLSC